MNKLISIIEKQNEQISNLQEQIDKLNKTIVKYFNDEAENEAESDVENEVKNEAENEARN